MRELPILFAAPMVRAIPEGRKTQTRRIVKPQPPDRSWSHRGHRITYRSATDDGIGLIAYSESSGNDGWSAKCPYGQPGDRLWVRETWQAIHVHFDPETGCGESMHHSHDIPPAATAYWNIVYAADPDHAPQRLDRGFPWRPAIHMPRWASRITLELDGVRVERLQDISEADAITEGILRQGEGWCGAPGLPWFESPIGAFRSLWESINGAGSWDANPWVWAIEFQRVEQMEKAA